MPERMIFHNPDHVEHKGWIDSDSKAWDVPERLFFVIDSLLDDTTRRTEEFHTPELREKTIRAIERVHDKEMIRALADASKAAEFDGPATTGFDKNPDDGSTSIYPGTFEQALMSAECASSAADALLAGRTELAITVSRPPGHHAGRNFYHGFCVFNTAAVAAETFKENNKRVAILDFDIHHGDGTQDIFNEDPDVLYASLHADPNMVLPGTGYASEVGAGAAVGTIINVPLPVGVDAETYFSHLASTIGRIKEFSPDYLIIEAGFDGHKDEYIGLPPISQLGDEEYGVIGEMIGRAKIPSLVIFGGGYNQEITGSAFASYIQGMEVGRGIR